MSSLSPIQGNSAEYAMLDFSVDCPLAFLTLTPYVTFNRYLFCDS